MPVADEEPDALKPLPHSQVASLLSDPRRVGVCSDAEDVRSTGPDPDREEHVQRPKPRGLHSEEGLGAAMPGGTPIPISMSSPAQITSTSSRSCLRRKVSASSRIKAWAERSWSCRSSSRGGRYVEHDAAGREAAFDVSHRPIGEMPHGTKRARQRSPVDDLPTLYRVSATRRGPNRPAGRRTGRWC
jgi:hypothetical protein